ncbi:MAG: glutamate--tRNA ligase [Alphaproteobacteria bacterium]|nr:glutamate--tRNA ligase [Alphaproteobacteria bacterium]
MAVVTRFAPSPTGYLHIGGARTALFNWLYAHHHSGSFRLRVEDTDRKRSTEDAVQKIFAGLEWLELESDGEPVFQSHNAARHVAVAEQLIAEGKAYRCYCTPEELTEMREVARAQGRTRLYDRRWRDRDPADAPAGVAPSVRVKMPIDGETVITDLVQGEVRVANDNLDDFIILRPDGTPTYMLAVVVDDHDMGITHIIRGDDHLNNAFRQYHVYGACAWDIPAFAHIPLIHGGDGKKLSKRHGALGVEAYQDMGILPSAMRNYLLRLGWSHGDDEIISTEQAIEWFDLSSVGRSPARFDMEKLTSLNGHYIRESDDGDLVDGVLPIVEELLRGPVTEAAKTRLRSGIGSLKERVKNIKELAEKSLFYCQSVPLPLTDKAVKLLDAEALENLAVLAISLEKLTSWEIGALEACVREFADAKGIKLGQIAQPLRAVLTGSTVSPGIFDVMAALGRGEAQARIQSAGKQ